jgi:hypothetical protein
MLAGAAGKDARAAYAMLTRTETGATLARDVFAKSVLTRLGATISFALLVDTARITGDSGNKENATVVVAYGKDPKSTDRAWFELDIPSSVIKSYAGVASALLGGGATPPAAGSNR